MADIRPVVIGAGVMGGAHLAKLLNLPQYAEPGQVAAVEVDDEKRSAILQKFPQVRVFPNIETAANVMQANMAIVAVPAHIHRRVLDDCAYYGIRNILIEKPLVDTAEDLVGLGALGLRIYTGHVINFSGIIPPLLKWMRKEEVFPVAFTSDWYQDWTSNVGPRARWIESAGDGKIIHPLALAFSVIEAVDQVESYDNLMRAASRVPHILAPIRKETIEKGQASLEDRTNSTAMLSMRVLTVGGEESWVNILGSFDVFGDQRFVSITFAEKGGVEPKYKAALDFDREGKDHLVVREVGSEQKVVLKEESGDDKLQAEVAAAVRTFETGKADSRLTDFNTAVRLMDIVNGIPKYRLPKPE